MAQPGRVRLDGPWPARTHTRTRAYITSRKVPPHHLMLHRAGGGGPFGFKFEGSRKKRLLRLLLHQKSQILPSSPEGAGAGAPFPTEEAPPTGDGPAASSSPLVGDAPAGSPPASPFPSSPFPKLGRNTYAAPPANSAVLAIVHQASPVRLSWLLVLVLLPSLFLFPAGRSGRKKERKGAQQQATAVRNGTWSTGTPVVLCCVVCEDQAKRGLICIYNT